VRFREIAMPHLLENIAIRPVQDLFIKDPTSTQIGLDILTSSSHMIASQGLETFTFRKLATAIGTTETTIYRYFKNKQQLAMYLVSCYWNWLEWQVAFATANVAHPDVALNNAIGALCSDHAHQQHTWMQLGELQRITAAEAFKGTFLVDSDESLRKAWFYAYAHLCQRLEKLILDVQPAYAHPKALAGTLLETAQHQQFLMQHLPELTDLHTGASALAHHLQSIAFTALR
jgi:AcrR family transcriptional regulator